MSPLRLGGVLFGLVVRVDLAYRGNGSSIFKINDVSSVVSKIEKYKCESSSTAFNALRTMIR